MNSQHFSKYVGIPYKPRGRDKTIGLDCWGLIHIVLKEMFGINVPSYNEYDESEDWVAMSNTIKRNISDWSKIQSECARAGDVVLIRMRGEPLHVGIVIDSGTMLHILKGINSVVEHYDGIKWQRRVLGIYRYGGVTHAG